ncbi:MAG: N-acetylmuramoyl-L-alanine amidase [Stellaceae bacterium]
MIAPAIRERPSPNHDRRSEPARIDMLVLHYTGMQSAEAALDRLCDRRARVSAHYVIDESGVIWRLVPEAQRAFHAGLSCWQGERDLNFVSIGVEIVNPGHEWGYRPFPQAQMSALESLCAEILLRHPIPPSRIVGHSDIAPDRKTDPGELFDWPRLARAGIGLWPEPRQPKPKAASDRLQVAAQLAAIGYCTAPASEVLALAAFQRRFRPARIDGVVDSETAARITEVREAYEHSRAAWRLAPGAGAPASVIGKRALQRRSIQP